MNIMLFLVCLILLVWSFRWKETDELHRICRFTGRREKFVMSSLWGVGGWIKDT